MALYAGFHIEEETRWVGLLSLRGSLMQHVRAAYQVGEARRLISIFLGPVGTECQTFDAAFELAGDGGLIFVKGDVPVFKPITVPDIRITICAHEAGGTLDSGDSRRRLLLTGGSEVCIKGVHFDGVRLEVHGVGKQVTLSRCRISSVSGFPGLHISSHASVECQDCEIYGRNHGVAVRSSDMRLRGCHFHGNHFRGVDADGRSSGWIDPNSRINANGRANRLPAAIVRLAPPRRRICGKSAPTLH